MRFQPSMVLCPAHDLAQSGVTYCANEHDHEQEKASPLEQIWHERINQLLSQDQQPTLHDFGRVSGFYYLLMEYVDGVNLRQELAAERFSPEQALAIVPPVCQALQFAHDRGVVHRDIKPENLLLDKTGHQRKSGGSLSVDFPDTRRGKLALRSGGLA